MLHLLFVPNQEINEKSSINSPTQPSKALQVKPEWLRTKVHKDRALRINPNCRIQTCLDQAFVDPVECVSQELPVLAEEDPPRGVVQAASHVVSRSELGAIWPNHFTPTVEDSTVVTVIAIRHVIPTWHF